MNKFDKLFDEPNWKDRAAKLQAQVDEKQRIIDGFMVNASRAGKQIQQLEREIDILRTYGNKDCTAMADEHLAGIKEL